MVVSNRLGIAVRSRETTQGLTAAGTQILGNMVSGNIVGALLPFMPQCHGGRRPY